MAGEISVKCIETFLRIESQLLSDAAPEADAGWLQSRGIEPESLEVVRLVRRYVVPLVQPMGLRYVLLIHGAQSGVPTSTDDPHAYLHLRIFVTPHASKIAKRIKAPWTMTRTTALSNDMAGVSTDALPAVAAWHRLSEQSRWFVDFIAAHDDSVSDLQVVKHLRQFLHFFANMAQMRVA
jgi:hypothetical protein